MSEFPYAEFEERMQEAVTRIRRIIADAKAIPQAGRADRCDRDFAKVFEDLNRAQLHVRAEIRRTAHEAERLKQEAWEKENRIHPGSRVEVCNLHSYFGHAPKFEHVTYGRVRDFNSVGQAYVTPDPPVPNNPGQYIHRQFIRKAQEPGGSGDD